MLPIRSSLFRSIATLGMLASVSACAVPDLGARPVPRTPASIAAGQSFAGQGIGAWPADGWWHAYGDAQLISLIEEGLKGSPAAAAAAARFRMAQGMAQATGARLLPTLDAQGSAYLEKQSRIRGIPPQFFPGGWEDYGQAALDLNYDVDLWGRNRAALAAATSEVEAARIEQNQAWLALTTAIAATAATTVSAAVTTATAEATASAAAEAAAITFGARTGLVHHQVATVEVLAVGAFDRRTTCIIVGHLHESEAAATVGGFVHDDLGRGHLSEGREEVEEILVLH